MDISFLGISALRIKGKKTALVVDPFDKQKAGISFESSEADGVLLTAKKAPYLSTEGVKEGYRVVIDGPGEYEVGGIGVVGVAVAGVTTYYIKIDGVTLLDLGLLEKVPTDTEIDKFPAADIVFVPVGGKDAGTISGEDAAGIVGKLEPKIVVPIGFKRKDDSKLTIDLASIDNFLKAIGKEGAASQSKLTITREKLPTELEVIVLE